MNIGILICGHFSDDIKARYGTYRDLYADMLGPGYACRPYFVVDGEFPASITEQDGWLVSGSRSGAYEDHPWIPDFEAKSHDSGPQNTGFEQVFTYFSPKHLHVFSPKML